MRTEIFIENNRLDVTEDISMMLNYALDDVKDFSSRNTSFSKTIVLPGTANNNLLFGHIFNVRTSNEYDSTLDNYGVNYNPAKGALCLIFNNHVQVFKGTLRILEIAVNNGIPEYECVVFGELSGLVAALASNKLEDLDFSAYDHTLNVTNIQNSWDNNSGISYYYPLIDYGLVSTNKVDYDYTAFRPAFFVREYIDKMITDAGYTWESDLFNTDRFKRLIVPHNQKNLQRLSLRLLSASRNNAANVIDSGTSPTVPLEFSSVSTSIFTATNSNSRFTYNGAAPINLLLNISFTGNYIANVISFSMSLKKNGTIVAGTTQNLSADGTDTTRYYGWTVADLSISLTTNDYIELVFEASAAYGSGNDRVRATNGTLFVDSFTAVPVDVVYNDGVEANQTIPKNILQKDFLTSVLRLFNLYVYDDQYKSKHLKFKPYVDFYDLNASGITDWTYKMDRSKEIRIRPMSELNSRYYDFKFKQDNDFYNELYRKRYNKSYGDYIYDSQYEFAGEKTDIELIFSPTVLVGYAGVDKIVPAIYKQTNDTEEKIDTNIRILQTKKITGVTAWDIEDATVDIVSNLTDYGYAGHYDDPDAPANDIHFGVPEELFFTLGTGDVSTHQFNVYWSSYMAEITDKDSKLLSAYFKLTSKDIFDLDFSKLIYVDGSLWRLNKVIDWNANEPDVCKCELLKVINTIY